MVISVSDHPRTGKISRFPLDSKLSSSISGGVENPTGTTNSVAIDNLSQLFRNLTDVDMEFGANYTIMCWVKRTSAFTNNVRMFEIGDSSGNNNRVNWNITGTSQPDEMRYQGWDSSGSAAGMASINDNDFFAGGTWKQGVVVVQSTVGYTFYKNDTVGASDTFSNTITNTDRHFDECAHGLNGNFYAFAIWSVALDSNNRTAIYNGGDGTNFDLLVDSGNYNQSANLKHWWVPGADNSSDSAMGTDYGNASTLINIMEDAANITTADIVADSPT